jgi:transcriptional regulator with XRE-family HTH domain
MAANAIARRLHAIKSKGALRSADVAQVLSVEPATVSRWNLGKAFPHPGTQKQLLDLEFIVDKLADIYSPQEARMWLFARQRLLGDRTPAQLIGEGKADKVLALVNQLRDGVFT